MSVKVGVRVRPFNKREEQLGARLAVQMEGSSTTLTDSEGQNKVFNYDYSFWSHDGYEVDEEGYNQPISQKYADQHKVYQEIGSSILVNAWEGYNCCLFAYGQTGSGKSYSMIGYGANKGIIPIVCNEIFEKIKGNQDGSRSFEVKVSMLEIYNEAVRDLLSKSKKQELRICEHKTLGVYVQGLSKHTVDSYQKIQKKIEQGSNNRSIAATLMNQSSSRSHTIVSINFVQKIQISMEQTSVKYSVIHLVDLAGSECVAKTGANTKDRLRETAKINQSLSTLGRVIEILADNCVKREKEKAFVPYRDSKLTFILRSALGGNSRTAMICAISPADDNYEQTLSTLRYASRAKKIENRAIVNESDVDKLIRLLREQNQMLKKMLEQARQQKGPQSQEISGASQTLPDLGFLSEKDAILGDSEFDPETNSLDSSLNESVAVLPPMTALDEDLPYITNISEDQLLSFRIKYSCEKLRVGNKKGSPRPDVVLASLGVQPNHALISSEGERCFLEVLDESAGNYTFVNGSQVQVGVKEQLFDRDRIIFGTGCVFLMMFKGSTPRNEKLKVREIDYQFALGEVQTINPDKTGGNFYSEKTIALEEEEIRKRVVNEIELEFEASMKLNEEETKKQIAEKEEEYRSRLKEMEEKQQAEKERLKQELEQREEESKKLEEERSRVKGEVEKYLQETKVSRQREEKGKEELEETKMALEGKQLQIKVLQEKMRQLEESRVSKRKEAEVELRKQEQEMKRELQVQTVICHNENVINEYRLEVNKRWRHAGSVREMLVKRQRGEVMKQLTELVPQVERFNLMAKEMNKRIDAGLSIEYRYISDAEVIEISKNSNYKPKLKITVHIINRDQGRSYYWPIDIFRNRYELALAMWEQFIRKGKNYHISKDTDPYWDPQTYQSVAYAHLSLECLMFQLSFSGHTSIIKSGKVIGKLSLSLFPTDSKGNKISIEEEGEGGSFKIGHPHEYIEKNIYFVIEMGHLEVYEGSLEFESFRVEYEVVEGMKTTRFHSEVVQRNKMASFQYRRMHVLKQVSETTLIHYIEKPLILQFQVIQQVNYLEELTHRSSFSQSTHNKGSFAVQLQSAKETSPVQIQEFQNISPPKHEKKNGQRSLNSSSAKKGILYENTDVTRKVEEEYQRKKEQEDRAQMSQKRAKEEDGKGERKGKKEKECQIY